MPLRPLYSRMDDPSYDPFQCAYGKQLRERYGHAWDTAPDADVRSCIQMLITGSRMAMAKQGKLNPSVKER